jgi:hypothetical protein
MSTEMADRLNKIQTARDTASGSALISDLVIATSKLAPTETGTTTTSSSEIIASSSAPLIATTSLATEKNIQNCEFCGETLKLVFSATSIKTGDNGNRLKI